MTLEVSKFSGWLNAVASCQESNGGHTYGAVQGTGLAAAGGGRPRRTQRAGERARLRIRSRARGGAHGEHVAHLCDAGGVEAQRLVERRRFLPRVGGRAHTVRGELRAGRREAAGNGGARSVHTGEGSTADWEQGRGGAHRKHVAHVCDAGGVKAQRLVDRRRILPGRKESTRCERGAGRGRLREAGGREGGGGANSA